MNTEIHYMYRDASNYKKQQSVVISGTLSEEDQRKIFEKCDSFNAEEFETYHDGGEYYGEPIYFIPAQVGLPEERFDKITEDDHCWFEMKGFENTEKAPTVSMSAEEFLKKFDSVKEWDDVGYAPEYDEPEYEQDEEI